MTRLVLLITLGIFLPFTRAKNILLLREEQQNDPYRKYFKDIGFKENFMFIPVLDFEYYNLDRLQAFAENFQQYAGLIFTSRNAINAFELAVNQSTLDLISRAKDFRIYVVGRSSKIFKEKLNLSSAGNSANNAKELSEFIVNDGKRSPKPLVFPCGNLARETIPERLNKAGVTCKAISCYKTKPNQNFIANLKSYYEVTKPDVIVFFSPSGAEFFLSGIKEVIKNFDKVKIVAIGNYAANAIRKLNQKVDVIAKKPTPESLVEALESLDF